MAKSTQDALRHGEDLGHTPAISKEEIKKRIKMEWYPWKDYEETYKNRDAPMFILGPPCAHCEYWQPRRSYMDIDPPYGKVFNGVELCVAHDHNIEMANDFSCFSAKEETSAEAAPMGRPSKTLGDY